MMRALAFAFAMSVSSSALAQAGPGEEIDLLPPPKPPSPAEAARARKLEEELRERRSLLQIHQGLGFALLGAMATTTVLGQLEYADKYGGGGDTGKWHASHQIASYATAGIFAGAGLVALLAPAPTARPGRVDTAVLHRIAMAIATAGMVAQIALGIASARSEGRLAQRDYAVAHQITGYATVAATATGFVVLAF